MSPFMLCYVMLCYVMSCLHDVKHLFTNDCRGLPPFHKICNNMNSILTFDLTYPKPHVVVPFVIFNFTTPSTNATRTSTGGAVCWNTDHISRVKNVLQLPKETSVALAIGRMPTA